MGNANRVAALSIAHDAIIGFIAAHFWNLIVQSCIGESGTAMREVEMDFIDAVLELIEKRILAPALARLHDAVGLKNIEERKLWWRPGAHVGEDQPMILAHGVATYLNAVCEAALLSGLRHALARSVIAPPMINTRKAIALDTANIQFRATMGATLGDYSYLTAMTSEDRELLAHDLQRLRPADCDLLRQEDRLPKERRKRPARESGPTSTKSLYRWAKWTASSKSWTSQIVVQYKLECKQSKPIWTMRSRIPRSAASPPEKVGDYVLAHLTQDVIGLSELPVLAF